MSAFWFEKWWREEVSPKLSREEKLKIAYKIRDISLKTPLYDLNVRIPKSEVPELAPHTVLKEFTGIQLYVVLTEIMRELGHNLPSVSELAFKPKK